MQLTWHRSAEHPYPQEYIDTGSALDQVLDEAPAAPASSDELLELALRERRHPPEFLVRIFDVAAAGSALLVAAPLLAAIGVAVLLVDGRPLFFRQRRIGRFGEPFEVTKIRTMKVDAEASIADLMDDDALAEEFALHRKFRGDPRITRTGSFLRKSRLDELPQFLDVLRGDMSVVGPRPVVPSEIRRYGGFASVAFSVRPGITGRWQVMSSNAEDYNERVRHDVTFGSQHTFRDVLSLAMQTPAAMLRSLKRREFV